MRLGDAHRFRRDLGVAQPDERSAEAARRDVERHPRAERGKGEAEQVEARPAVERGRQRRAGDADSAAGHVGPGQRHLGDDGGEAERRHREIEGAQPQRGEADEHAGQRAGDAGNGERRQRAEPVAADDDARRIRADGQQADPTDRELAGEADDEVEAGNQHPVHGCTRGDHDQVVVAGQRDCGGGREDQHIRQGSDAEAHQTRRVGGAPNRPCGAAIRTTMKAEKTATETSTPPTRKFAAC